MYKRQVSVLEKGGNQYLVVVNRDFRNVMNLSIDMDSSVSRVLDVYKRQRICCPSV